MRRCDPRLAQRHWAKVLRWEAVLAETTQAQFRPPPVGLGPMLLAIGPGIVVSGSVIGSGELINVPVQAATFGFVLFWAVIISCVIKFFLQVELGRYCVVHNRTTIQAFNTCPGPKFRHTSWVGILYMIGYSASLVTVAGILGATAGLFSSLLPLAEDAELSKNIWAVITFIVVVVILWRGLYAELETLVALLVAGFSLSVVVALWLLQGTPFRVSGSDILSGLKFSLGSMDSVGVGFAVVSLLGALGTTANELFMYPYWILEKGYAHHLGTPQSAGWLQRSRGWVRVLRLDTGCATLLATVITAAYFLVGSAVLNQHGDGSLFTADDILDWPGLCSKLESAHNQDSPSPSGRIWQFLPEDVQRSVADTAQGADPKAKPDDLFIGALNEILERRDFYREEDFLNVQIPPAPQQAGRLLNRVSSGRDQDRLSPEEVRRFNRILLEASYPEEIANSVPSGSAVVKEISKIFTDTYGPGSYYIFMFGGFCTLFSTIVVVAAATGRMWTDLLSSMGAFDWQDQVARRRCNRVFQTLYLAAFLAVTLFISTPPEKLVMLGQWINGAFNTPLIMFAICWLAFRTDRRVRMNRFTAVMLLATVGVILVCLWVGLVVQAGH